jgi:hypothetical protein
MAVNDQRLHHRHPQWEFRLAPEICEALETGKCLVSVFGGRNSHPSLVNGLRGRFGSHDERGLEWIRDDKRLFSLANRSSTGGPVGALPI